MKNYATETDIITIADPLFYPGDKVFWGAGHRDHMVLPLLVESFSWNTLEKSWTYTLVYFLEKTGISLDMRWNGSLAVEEAFEEDLKLMSRRAEK
jgi:hypothetical protein